MYLFVLSEHDGIQYNTCLFQMNVMRFNTIYGTYCIDYHNTHLIRLHISFSIHIKHK